jgi:hypothetical protein
MDKQDLPVFVFNTHVEADEAIQSLSRAGIDVKKLSLVGKGYHSEERPVGFYTTGDKVRTWGGIGAFWGGIWGPLLAPAVFFVAGIGRRQVLAGRLRQDMERWRKRPARATGPFSRRDRSGRPSRGGPE